MNAMCMVLTESGTTTVTVGGADNNAAPIPASEWTSTPVDVGITYHDATGNVVLALSTDFGLTWATPVVMGQGSYPFVDTYPGKNKVCMSFINSSGTGIMTSRASGFTALLNASFTLKSDQPVAGASVPVVRYSTLTSDADIYGHFYMVPGPRDIWYDNSILTGIGDESSSSVEQTALALEPNPFNGSATVRVDTDSQGIIELGVYSMDGRLVEHIHSGPPGDGVFQVGGSLPSGVYSVVMVSETGTESVRMVKLQ